MFKKIYFNFLIVLFFMIFTLPIAYAVNDPSTDGGDSQDQSFPFDKECLKYDESNFKVGQALLDVMTASDFPQYCVLYSLSNYQIKLKKDEGYVIIGSKSGLHHAEATMVFLKSSMAYQKNQVLKSNDPGILKPVGQWAYFVGIDKFTMDDGLDHEFYVFQEVDF